MRTDPAAPRRATRTDPAPSRRSARTAGRPAQGASETTPARSVRSDPQARAALRAWGGPATFGASETLLWRSEVDPRLCSVMTNVMVLDRTPDWTRFRRDHQWLLRWVPRFTQRVVDPGAGGSPYWLPAETVDLGYHLQRIRMPAPGSERQLLDLAQALAMAPLDKARPPWQAWLIEGLDGARAAYVLRLHHTISDGLGIVQLMQQLLGTRSPLLAPASTAPPTARTASRAPAPSTGQRAPADALDALSQVSEIWARGVQTTRQLVHYASSALRVLGQRSVAGSPILRRRSLSMRFDAIEFPLAAFKAAAQACQGTVNDVLLAGLAGGWRRYHEAMGVAAVRMPIGFPVSVRKPGDAAGGNRFTALRYAAPVDEPDPIARVRDLRQFIGAMREEPALDALVRLTPVLALLPATTAARIAVGITSALDAQVSNVPGLAGAAMLSGARITHSWPFGPLPGCAMMITMVSHDARCCIGINSDPAAVIDPELMTECLRAGLQEMMALATPPTRRKRSRSHATPRNAVQRL